MSTIKGIGDRISMITFVKRSTLPMAVKGKSASPVVGVSGMGSIQLGKLATEFLAGSKSVVVAFDGGTCYIFKPSAKAVAKVAEQDHVKLTYPKKGGSCAFSGAAILRAASDFGASHVYDFKGSGNQTFAVSLDDKNQCITFSLPDGAIAKRPFTPRKKKNKAPATKANPGSTEGASVGGVETETELELEAA